MMSPTTKTLTKSTKLVVAPSDKTGIICPKCMHHSSRKTFRVSCPRSKELLFLGGDKSAQQIMDDVRENDCKSFNLKGGCTVNLTQVDIGDMVKEIDRRGMECRIRDTPRRDLS